MKRAENEYVFDPNGGRMLFGGAKNRINDRLIKARDGEKATGKWNTIDLYCYSDTSVHVVNGTVAMVLYDLSQNGGDVLTPLHNGKYNFKRRGRKYFTAISG